MISKPDSLHGRHVKQLVIFSYYSDRKGQDLFSVRFFLCSKMRYRRTWQFLIWGKDSYGVLFFLTCGNPKSCHYFYDHAFFQVLNITSPWERMRINGENVKKNL